MASYGSHWCSPLTLARLLTSAVCCAELDSAEPRAATHKGHVESGVAEMKALANEGTVSQPTHELASTASKAESVDSASR